MEAHGYCADWKAETENSPVDCFPAVAQRASPTPRITTWFGCLYFYLFYLLDENSAKRYAIVNIKYISIFISWTHISFYKIVNQNRKHKIVYIYQYLKKILKLHHSYCLYIASMIYSDYIYWYKYYIVRVCLWKELSVLF